jgi:hypothetical protein
MAILWPRQTVMKVLSARAEIERLADPSAEMGRRHFNQHTQQP